VGTYLVLVGVALYKAIESLSDIIFGLVQRIGTRRSTKPR
jgi:hypothetical protein